jgi:ABC-type sugar transport system permease subunit
MTNLTSGALPVKIPLLGRIRRSDRIFAITLLIPAILLTLCVVVIPLFYALYLSFTRAEVVVVAGRGGVLTQWVWFKNYIYFLTDPGFWNGIKVTLYFTVISLFVEMVLGIGVALVLNQNFRGNRMVRTLIILPWAIPTIVNARLWGLIFDPQPYGAMNGLMHAMGFLGDGQAINWLGSTNAINWIILADTWKVLPVIALMVLAGLHGIPPDLYEASQMDGANSWDQFWFISFPLLRPILTVILVYRTMELFRVFDILYILMAYTIPVMAVRTFQEAFVFGLFGRGSALAFLIGLFILGLSVFYMRVMRVEED